MAWRRSTSEVWSDAEQSLRDAGEAIKDRWGYRTNGEGVGIPGAGLVKGTVNVISRTAGKTVERTGEALQHRVVGPVLVIVGAIAAFKGIQAWFSRKSQSDEIEQEKARGMKMEAALSRIENGGAGPEAGQSSEYGRYQMHNPLWQGGHVQRTQGGQGQSGRNRPA
jgi:hypothetical protein